MTRHAGDLSARDAYTVLLEDTGALLLDVRTERELTHVGRPDLTDIRRRVVTIPWVDAEGNKNENFTNQLTNEVDDPSTPLLVICRSGARSLAAARAAAAAGFRMAINVADGFEGPEDDKGRRGMVSGWQASGLPWKRVV